jgi:hypothetical protein
MKVLEGEGLLSIVSCMYTSVVFGIEKEREREREFAG